MGNIKFKVWDKDYKRWLEEDELDINITLDGSVWVCYKNQEWVNVTKSVDLIRYTGLKDKNGVEMYEGDILRDTSRDGDAVSVKPIVYGVSGRDRIAAFTFGNDWSPLNETDNKRREVIGNIYDNPELLEVEKNA